MTEKARYVFWTANNPSITPEALLAKFEAWPTCTFVVFQEEVGEEGTRHFQGYSEHKSPIAWRTFANKAIQAHCEGRKGTQEGAIAYCTKEDTRVSGPYRWGTPRECPGQGARTDLKAFIGDIRAGKRSRDLLDSHPGVLAKYPRLEGYVRQAYPPESHPDGRRVVLHIGPPGTGKTRAVQELVSESGGELYVLSINGTGFWLDGYDGQPVALLDDFGGRASKLGLTEALRLLDRYVVRAPVKGGFVWWNPKEVHITTNLHPSEWYDYSRREVHYQALKRRFSCVKTYSAEEVHTILEGTPAWESFWGMPPTVGAPEAHAGGSPFFN